ncbi:hypothetical protein PGT21_018494 [Puccinia graminis f. sp. tritici]|uniref:Uncharacterized protein n=1 Tax=Puccinia graminis f. sp. tritici TaxID=56615 RepID=A0A5B0LVY7_PUCGR|nr:hypothetical protein PGTUg99_034403 [Puccinia graminis f. sp. tritici]KAA1104298.1 hypothetical protein PGT21_018494 [Puccinia graminis f. sp. tritici]
MAPGYGNGRTQYVRLPLWQMAWLSEPSMFALQGADGDILQERPGGHLSQAQLQASESIFPARIPANESEKVELVDLGLRLAWGYPSLTQD